MGTLDDFEQYKTRLEYHEKVNRKNLKAILKNSPREMVIEILKELKIIKEKYDIKNDKFYLGEK